MHLPETVIDRLKAHAKHLPPIALAKLAYAEKLALEQRGRNLAEQERHRERQERRAELQKQIGSLERHQRRGGVFTKADQETLAALRSELDALVAAMRQNSQEAPRPKWTGLQKTIARQKARLIPSPEDWLRTLSPRARFAEKRAELPKGKLGAEMLASVRAEQEQLWIALADNRTAFVDKASALNAAAASVLALAERGAPNFNPLFRAVSTPHGLRQGEIKWPVEDQFSYDLGKSLTLENGCAFLAWLHQDELLARVTQEVEEFYAFEQEGLPIPEREARERTLFAKIIECQRVEAAICWALIEKGVAFDPPTRMHPEAWLEIERVSDEPLPEYDGRQHEIAGGGDGNATLGVPIAAAMEGLKQ